MVVEQSVRLGIDATPAERGANAFEKEMQEVLNGVRAVDHAMDELQRETKETGREMQAAGKKVQTLGDKTRVFVGIVQALSALGIGLGIREFIGSIADFEEAIARVGAVTGATGAQLEALEAKAKQVGAVTSKSSKEAADALVFLGQSGFSAQEAIDALDATVNLSIAGNLDLARSADIVSNAIGAFGLEAAQAARVADVMAKAAASSNTDVEQLAQALKQAGPPAAALGLTLEQTAAAIGALGDVGIQAGQAGTGLRAILLRLVRPTKQVEDGLAKVGLTLADVSPATNDFGTILQRLAPLYEDAEAAALVFGIEATSAGLALVDGRDRVLKYTAALNEATGSAEATAKALADTLKGSIDELSSTVEAVVLEMGEAGFAGALRGVVDDATNLIRYLSGLSTSLDEVSTSGKVLSGILAALIGRQVSLAVVALTGNVFKLTTGLRAAIVALRAGKLSAQAFGLSASAAAGPIGLLVGVLTAIGTQVAISSLETSEFNAEVERIGAASDTARAALDRVIESERTYARLLREGNQELANRLAITRSGDIEAFQRDLAAIGEQAFDPTGLRLFNTTVKEGFGQQTTAAIRRQFGDLDDYGFALSALTANLKDLQAEQERIRSRGPVNYDELLGLVGLHNTIGAVEQQIDSLSTALEANAVSAFRNTAVVGKQFLDQLRQIPGAADEVDASIARFQEAFDTTVVAAMRGDVEALIESLRKQAKEVEAAVIETNKLGDAGNDAADGLNNTRRAADVAGDAARGATDAFRAMQIAIRNASKEPLLVDSGRIGVPGQGRPITAAEVQQQVAAAGQRWEPDDLHGPQLPTGAKKDDGPVEVRIERSSAEQLAANLTSGLQASIGDGLKSAIRGEFDPAEFGRALSLSMVDTVIDSMLDSLFDSFNVNEQRSILAEETTAANTTVMASQLSTVAANSSTGASGGPGGGGGGGGLSAGEAAGISAGIAVLTTAIGALLHKRGDDPIDPTERIRGQLGSYGNNKTTITVQSNNGANDVLRSMNGFSRDRSRVTYFWRQDRSV